MSLWHWHPSVVALLTGLVALYVQGLRRLRREGIPVPPGRIAAFAGGGAALAVAVLGPLAEWAEHVALSAHMAQHLLLTLVAPPLWLLGTPPGLLRPLARVPAVAAAGYVCTRPAVALPLASAALVLWHVPAFFEAALRHEALHVAEHGTLLATALLLWWPVLDPLPAWPAPAVPGRLLYLFLCTLPMMAVAAPVTLAERPLYPFYTTPAGPWPLAPRADQELAGVVMWLGGTIAYALAGTILFFRWAAREERADGERPETLPGELPVR